VILSVSFRNLAEFVGLIAPAIPVGTTLAREQLEVGTGNQPLDSVVNTIGLSAVLAPRLDDRLPHAGIQPLWIPARGQ
jgi:hypothetical protein